MLSYEQKYESDDDDELIKELNLEDELDGGTLNGESLRNYSYLMNKKKNSIKFLSSITILIFCSQHTFFSKN